MEAPSGKSRGLKSIPEFAFLVTFCNKKFRWDKITFDWDFQRAEYVLRQAVLSLHCFAGLLFGWLG